MKMYRKWLGLSAVALIGLLLIPEPASAQRRRGGGYYQGYGGYYGGYYYGPGYGGYYGPGYRSYYYGPGYYSSGWRYYGPRSRWYDYSYSYAAPGYYYGAPSYYADDSATMTYGAYDDSGGASAETIAAVDVKVPPDAKLWFDETQTSQTGTFRQFETPPLDPSRNFSYQVHARWKEGDRNVDQTRRVTVHAGDRVMVDFTTRPAASGQRPPRAAQEQNETPEGRNEAPEGGTEAAEGRLEMHEGSFVSFSNDEIVMTDPKGKRHSHTLAAEAQVIINGQPARPEDLKPEMKIRVTTKKGDPKTATRIEVRSKNK